MFEKLLEKILLSKLGKFISGLDRENLKIAVWQGDITLNNVHLNPDSLLRFQLPFILTFGLISKLTIKIPWTKLSSSPIEISLNGLYVLLTPQDKKNWEYSEEGEIIKRKELLESLEKKPEELTPEEELQQKSFIEKLTGKVLDNIKVIINDIHIRVECALDSRSFAVGVTLQSVESYTTDENWEIHFTDRHQVKNAHLPIYKMLRISGLSIYWTSLAQKKSKQIDFQRYSFTEQDYLIKPISIQAKVIHNSNIGKFDRPRYKISVAVDKFLINLTQKQFHDAIKLVEYFTKYSKFIMKREQKKKFIALSPLERTAKNLWRFAIDSVIRTLRTKKNRSVDFFAISAEQQEFNKTSFKSLHKNIKKSKELTDDELKLYNRIIYISKLQDLYEWNSQVISEIDLETRQASEKGWFRLLAFGKKKSPEETQSEETDEVEILPPTYVWLEFEFYLASGHFSLTKNRLGSVDQYESILFIYQGLRITSDLRVQGSDISLSINDLSVSYDASPTKITLINKHSQKSNQLLCVSYSSIPPNSSATAKLDLESQAVDVSLDPIAINSLLSFFLVLNVQDKVKTAAWDTFQEIQDSTQETLTDLFYKQSRFEICIKASGPRVKVFSQQGFFLLSLGEIYIKNSETIEESYEKFDISVNSLELRYEKNDEAISIIPSFGVGFGLWYLKSKIRENKWKDGEKALNEVYDVRIDGEVPRIMAKCSPSIYYQLRQLDKQFNLDIDFTSSLHLDKKSIIKNSKLITKLRKQGNNIQNWSQYIAILSGAYIYFFINDKESVSATEYYIKDCSITHDHHTPNTLKLLNRFGECVLSFPKEKDFQKWSETLVDQINKFRTSKSLAAESTKKSFEKNTISMLLKIPLISIKLCNEDGIAISETIIQNLRSNCSARSYDLKVLASIDSLSIKDLQRQSSSAHFKTFAQSIDEDSLINLLLEYHNSNSPLYRDQDLLIEVKLGKSQFNWNPDIISSTLSFFTFAEYSDPDFKKPFSVGMINPGHTLVKFHIIIDSIQVYLNNVQKEISLAVMSIKDTDAFFVIKNGGYHLLGTIGNLMLNDLTNYPKTVLREEIVPFTLFSVKEKSESLLRFDIFIYADDSPEKPKDIGSLVELELNSTNIVYVHQPFMRIIDYVSYKMIGVFDAQARVRDINHWSPIYKLSYLLKLPTIESLINDEDLMQDTKSFSSIKITMKSPTITLTPRPGYYEHFVVDLGDISIQNQPGCELQKNHEIWLDIYTIQMQNINIVSSEAKVAENFDMLLIIERPVLSLKQQADASIDKRYKIIAKCESFKLSFSHSDYRLALKLMDLNLTYDDQLENYMNPESIPYVHVEDPNHGGVFFKLFLEIDVFSVLLTHEQQEISELLAVKTTFEMLKFNDYASDMKFRCVHFVGLISEDMITEPKEASLKVSEFSNKSDSKFEPKAEDRVFSEAIFNIPADSILNNYKDHIRLTKLLFGPLAESEKNRDNQHGFMFDMKGDWDGSKNIIVKFEQLRINFHFTVIQMIQNFFYYGFPDYAIEEETPYDYMHKYKPNAKLVQKEILSQYYAPRLLVNLGVTNPLMVLPSFASNRVVVAQTGVNFMYLREKEKDEFSQDERAGEMKYVLHQLEIYTCKLEELMSKTSFLTVKKRRIMEPVQVFYECLYFRPSKLKFDYKIRYEVEKLILTLSYRDILLLKSVGMVQTTVLTKGKELIESLAIYPKDAQAEPIPLEQGDFKIFGFSGINILIINDALGAYSPILDLNFLGFESRTKQNKSLKSLTSSISLRINYYNPQIDVWEPFIELFTLNIDINNCPESNPQNQSIIILEEKMPLNINLTEAMIKHLQIVLGTWEQTSLSQINDLVSPISICNKTGYTIQAARVTARSEEKDLISIPALGITNFEIDSTEIRMLDFSKESLKILIDKYDSIEGILMNKLTNFVKEVSENVYVIIEVNFGNTTKMLLVRSEFAVVNETDYPFAVRFSKDDAGKEVMLRPGSETSVPVEYTRSSMGLKPLHYIDKSWIEFNLEEYRVKKSGDCTEIRIDDFYFLLVMVRDAQIAKKVTLYLKPPLIITNRLPCEMALQIFYDNSGLREINLGQNESYKEYSTSVNSSLQCSLKLPNFNFSNRTNILHKNKRPPKYITVRDINEDPLNVYIDYKIDSSHILNFYAPVVFINNTSVPITFYYKKTSTKKAAGQSIENSITPAHSTKKVRISMGAIKSKSFKIGAVGVKNVIQFLGDVDNEGFQMKYQFLYEILLTRVISSELLFTKVLIISPRYLLMNNMEDEDLVIKQYNSASHEILIARQSKEPFHWPDDRSGDLLILKVGCGEWNWSGAFSISNIGTFTVQCRQQASNKYKLIRIEIKLQNSTAYVLFSKENKKFSSYRLENKSSAFNLMVFQDGCREEMRNIGKLCKKSFAWSQNLLDHQLIVLFYAKDFNEIQESEKPDFKFKFALDEMNVIYKIPVNDEEFIYGRSFHQGSTKVLEFTDEPISREKKRETIISQTHVTIHKFGISIVEQSLENTCEVLYLSASIITILNQSTKIQNKTEVYIKSFQIDNQYNFSAIYPVLLYPADPSVDVLQFVALSFVDENPNCVHFEKVSMNVQPLTLNLESWIVRKLLEMIGRVSTQSSPVYDAMEVYKAHKSPTWTRREDIVTDLRYYIANMEIEPIKLILSFVPLKEETSGTDAFNKVARALGMAITAIDSVPVKLYSAEMTDVFGTRSQIFSVIWMHYRAQLASEIFTLIGHAEILGNPIGLLNNLGTGVVDFFYEPAQGLIKGPIGAGKGLLKGTGSLLKNTVQGTFGTVSKLANSLATGITLTQDREYLSSRQREKMNKPKNVVDGVGMGFKVFFSNLGKGIAGVVVEPIKGYKKKKIKGMLIGGARGLSGLIIKPMAGVLDAASKTAEGIKNTTDVFKKTIAFQRSRVPRPFYAEKSSLKPYNEYDAQVLFFINQVKKGIFIKEKFVAQAVAKDIRGEKLVCVLFLKKFVLADIRTKKLLWIVDVESIHGCNIIEKGIALSTSPSLYKLTKKKQSFLIPFPETEVKNMLFTRIREILGPMGINLI